LPYLQQRRERKTGPQGIVGKESVRGGGKVVSGVGVGPHGTRHKKDRLTFRQLLGKKEKDRVGGVDIETEVASPPVGEVGEKKLG